MEAYNRADAVWVYTTEANFDAVLKINELKRTQEAWDVLFPVAEKFPKNPTVKYNLACYATQLGRLWEAEQWLKLAFKVGDEKELRAMALQDVDLKPIWPKILVM